MPAKKAPKDTKDTQAAAKGAGGFSAFQLLIFVIATSSMAMNFAMIYGVIPLQGKFRYIPPLRIRTISKMQFPFVFLKYGHPLFSAN